MKGSKQTGRNRPGGVVGARPKKKNIKFKTATTMTPRKMKQNPNAT